MTAAKVVTLVSVVILVKVSEWISEWVNSDSINRDTSDNSNSDSSNSGSSNSGSSYSGAKTENSLLPGITKLISMLFFGDINWTKLLVLLKKCYWAVAQPMGEE